ncbi:MAG: hypothetical protein AB1805_08060 [Nitrospirota bacterium]
MTRFEEVQMKIAETAKNYLEIFNMQVFIEQFTLDRESVFSLTLPDMEPPYPLSATVSFTYDAFQTGITLYEDSSPEEGEGDIDTSFELEITVKLPVLVAYPHIEGLLDEIEENYPDTQPLLIAREMIPSDEPVKEYEITYSYDVEAEDVADSDLFEQIFSELKGVLELINERTRDYIDHTWYSGEE